MGKRKRVGCDATTFNPDAVPHEREYKRARGVAHSSPHPDGDLEDIGITNEEYERATTRRSVTLDVDYPAQIERTTREEGNGYWSNNTTGQASSAQNKGTKADRA